jgi:hypothetical protein
VTKCDKSHIDSLYIGICKRVESAKKFEMNSLAGKNKFENVAEASEITDTFNAILSKIDESTKRSWKLEIKVELWLM